jgi:hypothetical protein
VNTEQLIVLSTNNVPIASQNTLDFIAGDGSITIAAQGNGSVVFSVDGIEPDSLYPYAGVPSGSIPGAVFTVPFTLTALVSVFVNGVKLLPSSYTQAGTTFTLATPLVWGDSIMISGLHSS